MMSPPHDIAPIPTGLHPRKAGFGRVNQEPKRPVSMTMTADDILTHPAFAACARDQAQALLTVHKASPRTASPFASQQRWLMVQVALAAYFRNEARRPGAGLLAERFVDLVVDHDLASRNTAAAFVNEMLKYGILRRIEASEGKRNRPVEPSPATLAILSRWLAVHLATLDGLDHGTRSAAWRAQPSLLGMVQPVISDGLLASPAVREPNGTVALFTSINDGGIVMDRLVVGCQEASVGLERIPTDVMTISALSRGLNVSRTLLGRKLAVATSKGSLGWAGPFGRSVLWMSLGFWREYHAAQAVKLAIIDAAFAAGSAQCARDQLLKAAASA